MPTNMAALGAGWWRCSSGNLVGQVASPQEYGLKAAPVLFCSLSRLFFLLGAPPPPQLGLLKATVLWWGESRAVRHGRHSRLFSVGDGRTALQHVTPTLLSGPRGHYLGPQGFAGGERVSHPSGGTGSPEKRHLAALDSENTQGRCRESETDNTRPRCRNKETKISCILFFNCHFTSPHCGRPSPSF